MCECGGHNLFLMLQFLSFTPECDENLKPKVGMTFEGLEGVEKFYKAYAHQSGFGVRIGQQKKIENKVVRLSVSCVIGKDSSQKIVRR